MATTVAYAASMCTRKTNSSSNAKNGVACQEFYDSSYNYVGIVCFSGMNLANKVITGIWLSIDAARAGYGAGSTKTVYMRKANYQNSIASGVTGSGYAGNALGTFDGSFFGNSTVYQMTGTLFNNMAAYISQGNNTFTIYNPSPSASSQGYSYNYLQWTAVTITITYEEAVSQPSTSASSVNIGQRGDGLHQPGQHIHDPYAALYLWQHQRDDRHQCRRVRFLDTSADAGGPDPQRHEQRLHYHMPKLQRRHANRHPNVHADAERPIYGGPVHIFCDR